MSGLDRDSLDVIFDEALDVPPAERESFLARRCPDPEVRARVLRLLADAERDDDTLTAGGALGGQLGAHLAAFLEDGAAANDAIAGYRLVRSLGSGGMGHVWEAEQLEPVRRSVAVKIIRPGSDTGRVVARFEAERQTLAMMSHPGIAQVFDAGRTAAGRPFFAMELVDGRPLTEFCDAERLSVRERLRLFLEVCDAVQHAHRKGVIHRDLKPSNVLVTRIDGQPAPKVIDFGIARLVEAEHSGATLLTEAGTVVGTPEYMSPEQSGTDPGDVDTRTDVYTLGVLLYELLTGARPFERSDSSPAALAELFRDVRETEPALPSRRVSTRDAPAGELAAARSSEPRVLTRVLRGDLDWITCRALEKDRRRRYGSVAELAADIRRHLADEPVVAGPPGTLYRAAKFARRHGGLLAAAGAVLVALLVGLAGTITGWVRAREEAERARTQAAIAQAVNAFLDEDLLAAVAPGSQGRDVTMREALDVAAERLEGRFPDEPAVEASLRHTIGDTYMQLGRLDEASPQLERALALREEFLGEDDASTLQTLHTLGELRFYQGRGEEAEELIRRSFEGRERVLGADAAPTLAALSDLGAVAQDQGRLDEAERSYRDAYDRARVKLGDEDPYTLSMLHNLGALLRDRGRYEEAEAFLRRALDGSRKQLGDDHPETLSTLSLLGSVVREEGRLEQAEPLYEEALEAKRRVLGDEHPSTLLSANNLAMLRADLGQLEDAARLERVTLDAQRRVLGDDHDATILSLGNLGSILTRLGRPGEADPLLAEALERCRRTLGADHSLCASTLRKQGECRTAQGRYKEAERALREAHATLARLYGREHPAVALAATKVAELYETWGRSEDAAAWRARAESAGTTPSP